MYRRLLSQVSPSKSCRKKNRLYTPISKNLHFSSLISANETTDHIASGIGRLSDLIATSSRGAWVYTENGRGSYLDFTSGIGVVNLGHSHPHVVNAIKESLHLIHSQVNITHHRPMLNLIDRLLPLMPHPSLDTFFFTNSGAEAVENAIKLARHATKKQNIVVFQGGYHGRTFGTMSLTTSKYIYRAGFGPLLPGIHVVPFPYCLRCPSSRTSMNETSTFSECCQNPTTQLNLLLKQQTLSSEIAAIILEPVLGEGGYLPAPRGFLSELRRWCDENEVLLICDEVQTGFYRTGERFAIMHENKNKENEDDFFKPDILVMAKGIANGMPLSAIASRKELMDSQPPGSMGGTYSGNALACVAALATLDIMENASGKFDLRAHVKEQGDNIKAILRDIIYDKHPHLAPYVKDIRGQGLMIGMEFDEQKVGTGFATALSKACLEEGMLILSTSIYETIRFIPPLTVTEKEVNIGMEIFEKALLQVTKDLQ